MVHPVIELEDVSYTYPDGTDALNRISIRIDEGESAAIAGPNGAGKSTLLLIMAGLVAPSSGEVRIFGRKIGKKDIGRAESMSDIRKRIGIVFQDADTQLFSATVYDDVAFGPMHLGIGEDEVDEMVKSTLEFLGITHLSERHPYDLSGGEKRKAAIATALVSSPDVLLLDEPTADLDPKNRREFVELLKKLKEDGKTIVIATHEMDILPEVVERMIVLNGEIVREGSIGEVMLDEKLLERANLDVPVVTRLFKLLKNSDDIPLTVEEAIGRIKEMVGDK
ncbi:MAG: ABC transporter ATP-binding protein [Thermoplasmata archaeon]|nr:ABC transporter ATP-binding protein [Thermoplasmata archaeon]